MFVSTVCPLRFCVWFLYFQTEGDPVPGSYFSGLPSSLFSVWDTSPVVSPTQYVPHTLVNTPFPYLPPNFPLSFIPYPSCSGRSSFLLLSSVVLISYRLFNSFFSYWSRVGSESSVSVLFFPRLCHSSPPTLVSSTCRFSYETL